MAPGQISTKNKKRYFTYKAKCNSHAKRIKAYPNEIKSILTGSKDKRGLEPLRQFPVIFNSASV